MDQTIPIRPLPLILATLAAAVLSGCSRGKISSDVKDTGAWTRIVELHAPALDKTGLLKDAPKVEDSFVVPGAPWAVTREKKGEENVVTCKRTMQLGETLKRDVVCISKAGGKTTEVAVNECSVKETSPGVYTYRETIHWIGPSPKPTVDMDAAKALKGALPAAVATDASVRHLADTLEREFMLTFMGPPEPLMTTIVSQIMMNPDLAERNIAARMGDGLNTALMTEYGGKLTAEQRRATVQRLVEHATKMTLIRRMLIQPRGLETRTRAAPLHSLLP